MAFPKLNRCSTCAAFLGPMSVTCPSCGTRSIARAIGVGIVGLAASASVSVTLMACYGCPPSQCPRDPQPPPGSAERGAAGPDGGSALAPTPDPAPR